MDYLCCLHQLPAGWSRRMLWSELARINDREGFMSFLLSKRIVVLWTMTIKAAENFSLYGCASDAQICMILLIDWCSKKALGKVWRVWQFFYGNKQPFLQFCTEIIIDVSLVALHGELVRWLSVMCRSCLEKRILCSSPFLLRIKTPFFFLFQSTIFFPIRRPSLLSLVESRYIFISVFPSHLHMFLALYHHTYLCLLFPFMMILYGMLALRTSSSNSRLQPFILSCLPVEAIADVKTSELPKK